MIKMTRVLVVEDHEKWQRFHKNHLDLILGEGNVDIVGNYQDAVSLLDRDYALYVVDGQFPMQSSDIPQVLGTQLAQEIGRRNGCFDKIVIVSSSEKSLSEAQRIGIDKVYNKFLLNCDQQEVDTFSQDLRYFLAPN